MLEGTTDKRYGNYGNYLGSAETREKWKQIFGEAKF